MALWDEVEARYNAQELVALTRAGENLSATTVNTTRAAAAVADVEAEFLTQQVGTFDDTDAQHVSAAVEGVIVRLKAFAKSGDDAAKAAWTQWKAGVRSGLARVANRASCRPKSSSPATANEPRPFDPTRFNDLVPDAPPTAED